MNIRIFFLSMLLFGAVTNVSAQEVNDSTDLIDTGVTYVEPLFEYPTAPENLETFTDKCDWLAENFWNKLNVKNQEAVDQAKLNHAFYVYATTIQYATKDKVTAAVDKLMKSIQKNPMLLYQMTKAAEETIYGPRSEFWIDELYARILSATLANKKFPKSKRARYELQLKQLEHSLIGVAPNRFEFTRNNGEAARYFPMSTPTILIFGDPECDDCRMAKLRMQSNVAFNKAVTDGKINVLFIIPDPEDGWEKKTVDFPKNWTVGGTETVSDLYDIRDIPEIYLIGADGKIIAKHLSAKQAMEKAMELLKD
ncbi:MAG: DUF5106 domain-containing protein [Muribaculaceae bacterium]|nr:DUF5106 domain-containing protein [Muribaculaceae bacterium]